jgi:hypothetical protein
VSKDLIYQKVIDSKDKKIEELTKVLTEARASRDGWKVSAESNVAMASHGAMISDRLRQAEKIVASEQIRVAHWKVQIDKLKAEEVLNGEEIFRLKEDFDEYYLKCEELEERVKNLDMFIRKVYHRVNWLIGDELILEMRKLLSWKGVEELKKLDN